MGLPLLYHVKLSPNLKVYKGQPQIINNKLNTWLIANK